MVEMEAEFESRVLREIEEEVQSILHKSKEVERKVDSVVKQRISYYKLPRTGVVEEASRKVAEGEVVLVAFNGCGVEEVKRVIAELKEKIREGGGRMYLIKWPTVLVVPREAELSVHG